MTILLSARDKALQAALPALPVPHDSDLPALPAGQRRLLLAADGLYLQARSSVMQVSVRVATATLPYGPHQQQVILSHGPVPASLVREAARLASATPDKEVAAAVVWKEGAYRLEVPEVISAGAGHVSYHDRLDDDALVMDIHSHGAGRAFFSSTDDASDLARPGPYLALVLGCCGGPMEVALRLVCPPHLVELPVRLIAPADGGLVVKDEPRAA